MGLRWIELYHVIHLSGPRVVLLPVRADIEHALFIDGNRGIDVVSGPEAEHPLGLLARLESTQVSALHEAESNHHRGPMRRVRSTWTTKVYCLQRRD